MAERLLDTYVPWFDAAFDKAAGGDRILYEVIFGMQNTPNGPLPQLLIFAALPSPVLGEMLPPLAAQMNALGLTQETIERDVRLIVEQLLKVRSEALSALNGGHPAGTGKIAWPPPDGATPIRPPGA